MSVPAEEFLINGRYRLLREIGRGATGHVFSAWDTHLDREVAVKVLAHEFLRETDIVGRFEHEIRCTARLQHPGLVAVFESGRMPDGALCYVMTLARGQTFDDYLDHLRAAGEEQWQAASLVDRLTLFLKMLDVIAYAHSQEVVHRDLKPANVMLGSYGEVWVLDWGLARDLRAETQSSNPEVAYEGMFGGYESAKRERHKRGQVTEIISQKLPTSEKTLVASPSTTRKTQTLAREGDHQTHIVTERIATDALDASSKSTRKPGDEALPDTGDQHSSGRDKDTSGEKATVTSGLKATRVTSGKETVRPVGTIAVPNSTTRAANAGSTSGQRPERKTQLGEVLGSPAYMSPEQARGSSVVADQRSDIYSLGVILCELLTLRTPAEMEEGEKLAHFIRRVQDGKRRTLLDLWPDAPKALDAICESCLAIDPQGRYADCAAFALKLRTLLAELSASYSELERQRLAKEREGAWAMVGSWDFSGASGVGPFTDAPMAFHGEAVGQVMHPELGGLLVGGWGLQIYPMALPVGNDMRLDLDIEVINGSEIWIFMRGVPPSPAYQFRIGHYAGRWLAIGRSQGDKDLLDPELLTMRPLRRGEGTTTLERTSSKLQRVRAALEIVGSRLSLTIDDQPPLVVDDTCPIGGPLHRQMAIATWQSHAVVRQVQVHQRRSPLMVPSYAVANELMRQNLFPQAIDFYRRFLTEHPESGEVIEAHFMLCLAFLRAGYITQAERELRGFLSQYLEQNLAQDAIFELARLVMEQSGSIERAVRVVLSYQESGDFVRSRFSLMLLPLISARARDAGITDDLVADLELVRQLIRGSPDEQLILSTMAQTIGWQLQSFINRLLDQEDVAGVATLRRTVRQAQEMGYLFPGGEKRTHLEYLAIGRHLLSSNDLNETARYLTLGVSDPLRVPELLRDILSLVGLGCIQQVLACLVAEPRTPIELLVRAGLYARLGRLDDARTDLTRCFQLIDVLETDRSNPAIIFAARLGCYGLGLLPWPVLWGTLVEDHDAYGEALAVLGGWLAESLGNRADAVQAYRHANRVGSGFVGICTQGLTRLGDKVETSAVRAG